MSDPNEPQVFNPTVEVPDAKIRPRSAFDPPVRVTVEYDPELRVTKQSFEEESNINYVVAKYRQTGVLPTARKIEYGTENEYEYQQKQIALANLRSKYYELSPEGQSQFQDVNDFLNACLDPSRSDELFALDQVEGHETPNDPTIPQGQTTPPEDPSGDSGDNDDQD